MSGVGVQVLSHVVRRGVEQYPANSWKPAGHQVIEPTQVSTTTIVLVGAILVFTTLLIASVDYTVGSVMATLLSIESPSSTVIADAPPAYSDEPDAPLEKKEYALPADVEVVVINHKPITSSIFATIRHLHLVGGFYARWRGLFQSILYHVALNVSGHMVGGIFSIVFNRHLGQVLGYIVATVLMCRLHMLWTHAMIAAPTSTPWYKRFATRKEAKALLLPSLVKAVAQQLIVIVPGIIAVIVYVANFEIFATSQSELNVINQMGTIHFILFVLGVLAVPASALLVVFAFYLPASAALIRIEACLLADDQETIVPFDREALMGDIDLTQRCSAKKLFKAAYASCNGSLRWKLMKLGAKLVAFQFAVVLVAMHLIGAVIYLTSRDQVVQAFSAFSDEFSTQMTQISQ